MPDTLTHPPAEAAVGHNSAAVGEMIAEDPALIYRDAETMAAFFAEIEEKIAAHPVDLTTGAGRDAIASLAYGIAKHKTRLDNAGKALNEDHRAAINKVDAVRRTVRDKLDALRDQARAPLTEWEGKEKQREARVAGVMDCLAAMHSLTFAAGVEGIKAELGHLDTDALKITPEVFKDRAEEAAALKVRAREHLGALLKAALQAEADRAELQRLRDAEEKRLRDEAEAKAKAEADAAAAERAEDERQRREAEVKAAADRAAEEARSKERAESEKARAAEAKAAQDKIDAAEREKREAVALADAERKAAADALAAREKADAEAKRQADAEAAEAKRRQADQAHRERVVAAAIDALIRHTTLDDEQARTAILAIAAGQVPAVAITF